VRRCVGRLPGRAHDIAPVRLLCAQPVCEGAKDNERFIRYHSNHHFSKVHVKPECSYFYINNIQAYCYQLNEFSLQQVFEMISFRTDTCPKSLYFRLNTSSSTLSMLAAVHAVLGLPLTDFLVIDAVCFKRLTKSFNVFFFQPLAGNSLLV